MFCSKCGAENPNNSKFCSDCGQSIDVKFVTINRYSKEEIDIAYYKTNLQMQKEVLKIQQKTLEEQKKQFASMAKCPGCGSTSLAGNKKGYGIGKGVIGAAVLGPFGLVAGNLGAKKVIVTCMKCGKKFKA